MPKTHFHNEVLEAKVQSINKGGIVSAESNRQKKANIKSMSKLSMVNQQENVYFGFIFSIHKLVKYLQPIFVR
jgi:hypothetical protein